LSQILHVIHFLGCIIPRDPNKHAQASANRADD